MRTSQRDREREAETVGLGSYSPIDQADGEAPLVNPAVFHMTGQKKWNPNGYLAAGKNLLDFATFRRHMKQDKYTMRQFGE